MNNATRIRPRFRYLSSLSAADIIDFVKEGVTHTDDVEAGYMQHHVYLRIPDKDMHYWSPELHLTLDETEENTVVRGVIGPKPKVWTMFMFFYSGVIVLFMFGSAIGVSQWWLGLDAPWLWSMPAAALLGAIIFVAAKIGQNLGKAQMHKLINFVDDILDKGELKTKVE